MYIYQGLELESPKHRVVKTLVPGPFLHLNASPAAGPVPAQLNEEDNSKLRFREKVSVKEEVGSIYSEKAEIYLIEFPSVSTSKQKPLSKATIELCVSWELPKELLTSLLPTQGQSSVPRAADLGDLLREKGLL